MPIKIQNRWYRFRANFWFIPALIAIAAILLSFTTTAIDNVFINRQHIAPWLLYSGGPDGARTVLSVIAGSMMTVAGVVFSITIVVLSLASSQFGPRLIRNFMDVRANQAVLGIFVATFMYCILGLHGADATQDGHFTPSLSVTIGVFLSLVSLGLLIYFIHNISESIQAETIIARVRRDLEKATDRIFPEQLGQADGLFETPIHRDYASRPPAAASSARWQPSKAATFRRWTTTP